MRIAGACAGLGDGDDGPVCGVRGADGGGAAGGADVGADQAGDCSEDLLQGADGADFAGELAQYGGWDGDAVAVLEEIWAGAKAAGLPVHLDGARVFNAAAALGVTVAELTRGFDTVMFCLSKGLGAPVGSMLVGSKELIEEARGVRKALGGGMRQAGVLAAAGLIALTEMPKRLHEDHANARLLAEAVAGVDGVAIDLETVETNIVIFTLKDGGAAEFVSSLKAKGVASSAIGTHQVRFVTHFDVSREDCERAARASVEVLEGQLLAVSS